MTYRAILDEELKPMNEPPEDGLPVLVLGPLGLWSVAHAYRGKWKVISLPDYYAGWVNVPRIDERNSAAITQRAE